jgi:DnaD/phage-associated family protein
MSTVYYIHDELHFSEDLLDYLMQYCAGNHKKDFRYMEKVAINWNQKDIKSPEQAQAEIGRHDSNITAIMRSLGMENSPTDREISFISKWSGELGFTMEIILEACDRTVMATQKNRLKYCDKILRSWHENNVSTKEDIARLDDLYTAELAKKKAAASKSSIDTNLRLDGSSIRPGVTRNRFTQIQENSYDFTELEKQLLDN